jgi:predicted metal-dependent HD superfamily phosphohydrolase
LDEHKLAERFADIWEQCATTAPEPVWTFLREHYQQPHRFYHTLDHIDHCLRELDVAGEQIAEYEATELAIWFHDIIYHYGAKDNEIRSAEVFRDFAGTDMPAELRDRVYDFIIATQHTGAAADAGTALMVDIDLSGFGLPWEGYLADSEALRLEAPEVDDATYYAGKLRFLDGLLEWPNLFQSDHFKERLENTAKENIKRYAAELRARGFNASDRK